MFKYFTADTNNQEEYAFANGIIRKLEKGLLNKDILDRMIKSSDAVSALKILTESDLNNYSFDLNNPADFENSLNQELSHTYDIIKSISKVSTFNFLYFTFACKYDFHNIKILIKAKYLKKDISNELFSPIGTIDIEKLNLAVKDEKYEDIPASFEFLIKKTFSESGNFSYFRCFHFFHYSTSFLNKISVPMAFSIFLLNIFNPKYFFSNLVGIMVILAKDVLCNLSISSYI